MTKYRCPKCKRLPETFRLDINDIYVTTCTTERCKCELYCIGKTASEAEHCWDVCIKGKDY